MRDYRKFIYLFIVIISFIIFNKLLDNRKSNVIEQLNILNVPEIESIKEEKNNIINNSKFMHISLDDFIEAFEDITNNSDIYNSIFENSTFSYLKMLHDNYGAVISCYTYYESDNKEFNLSQCTDKYKNEFEENSVWLKFSFHTLNSSKNYSNISGEETREDYYKVLSELLRITGSYKCIDTVIRLQNFVGNKESLEAIMKTDMGIQGVLGADDKRRSYYLDDYQNSYLYNYDYYVDEEGLDFFRTDLRIEFIDDIDKTLYELKKEDLYNKNDILIIFTHEWQLENNKVKDNLERVCEFGMDNGYKFEYPMYRIN